MTDQEARDAFGQPSGAASSEAVRPPKPSRRREPTDGRPRRSPIPLLFTLAAIVVTGYVLYQSDQDALDSPTVIRRELDGHALAGPSLVRAANLRRALGAVRSEMEPGEVLLRLQLKPEGLSTTVRDDNGNTRFIDVGLNFDVRARDWSTDTSSKPLDIAALDPAAAEKVVRGALRGAKADDTHLAYASLSGGDPPTWYVSLEDVPIGEQTWSADLAGIAVTHPGELPFASGLTGRSLLRDENFAAALEQASTYGRRVTSVRLGPQSLNVTVRGDGRSRDVQVDAAQRLTVRDTSGSTSGPSMAIDAIDTAAPARAFRTAAERGGVSPAKADYAVLFPASPGDQTGARWGLYFKDVPDERAYWRSDAAGRHVERTG